MNLSGLQKIFPGVKKHLQAYRMVNKPYASSIDEIGISMTYGWRYNPKGEFGVLYLSLSPECCLKEKIKQAGDKSFLPEQIIGEFEIQIQHCLDLTNVQNLFSLETNVSSLVNSDFSEPQSLAREARRIGFEAILAPSAVGTECVNLVVFKDKLARHSFCELVAVGPPKL